LRAHLDRFAVEDIVADEGPDAVFEAAAHWCSELSGSAAVEPPAQPLPGIAIVGAKTDAAIRAAGRMKRVVADIAEAAEHRPVPQVVVELFPLRAADEPLLESTIANLPGAHQKIPIVWRVVHARQRSRLDVGACEKVFPVHFPGLAAVGREGLFPMRSLA